MKNLNYVEKYRSSRLVIAYNKEYDILRNQWLTFDISDDDMKYEMQQWMTVYEVIKAANIITDNNVAYIILPKMQEWMSAFLFPKIVDLGAKRWAFIVGTDIFSAISVEQMATEIEFSEQIYRQRFFEDESEAVTWVLKR